ncbi:hypothetical protein CLIB1444_03S02498 [[Candida] jaroonii]|uniref:Uncharacterized protein n=1 Tax=[Candida] jaroonii TaxID=467808 RepID=A0ACA9Y513_9ASCO|nr:hypothetical protein CLIB1444_03S02498 [[Candida] jaroonii]
MSVEKPIKRRTKTGCLTCRQKHKKCDEKKPYCGLCTKKGANCVYPPSRDRVTSNSFRIIQINEGDNESNLKKYSSRLLETLNEEDDSPSAIIKNHSKFGTNIPSTVNNSVTTNNDLTPLNNHNLNNLNKCHDGHSSGNEMVTSPEMRSNHSSNGQISNKSSPHMNFNTTTTPNLQNLVNQENSDPLQGILKNAERVMVQPIPPTKRKSIEDEDNEISPDSLMAPFLTYSHLHRTFRDYMFTNLNLQPNNDVLDSDFQNILENPLPTFLNPDNSNSNSSKSLQEILAENNYFQNITYDNQHDNNILINDNEKLILYKRYLNEIAPWLDMFDHSKQFGSKIPELAKKNQALLNSIYAIASRQIEQTNPIYESKITIKLYQDTLKYLIPTVNKTLDISSITSTVILCVFEMMSSSPRKWRYHLEGCAALFKAHGIHGFSDDLERGLFWCMARSDVCCAIIDDSPTIIPSEFWIPYNCNVRDSRELFNGNFGNKVDMYANYMVFLTARVVNMIAETKENYDDEWKYLWDEISDWFIKKPIEFEPVLTFNDVPFPGILLLNGPAISAIQMFHMAVILLIQNKPRLTTITHVEHMKSPIWHAKQICSISLHNEHHGCWNNALQPLWIAGQLLSSSQEHEIVLNLLSKIESTTGWQMNFRANDLKKYWDENL